MKLSQIKKRIIKNMLDVKEANENYNPFNSAFSYPPLNCTSVDEAKEREELYLISLEMREEEMRKEF